MIKKIDLKTIMYKIKRRARKYIRIFLDFVFTIICNQIYFLKKTYSKRKINYIIKNKSSEFLIKLNLGCGLDYKIGWINIDNNSDQNIVRVDIKWDLRRPLPFKDNSVDLIFNEHFLEHLTVEDGIKALCDFRRILRPKGVIRIAMPDLKTVIDEYLDPNWKQRAWLSKFGMSHVQTQAELININFHAWGHKYLYNKEELERRLREVGFYEIRFCKWRESCLYELNDLETRDESTLIVEAVK